jgi:hypothetical protein
MAAFRAAAMGEIGFEECVVDAAHRFGGAGMGLPRVAADSLSNERVPVIAVVADAVLGGLLEFAFGRTSGLESLAAREPYVRIEAAPALPACAADPLDGRQADHVREAIVAKLAAADAVSCTAAVNDGSRRCDGLKEARAYTLIKDRTEVLLLAIWKSLVAQSRQLKGRANDRTT